MKIAVATDDDKGLEAVLSQHFGRCPYYVVVDIDDGEIKGVETVQNPFYGSHGQPGEVPSFIKNLGIQAIIAGGMGPRAIGFFEQFGIQAVTGVSGVVKEVVRAFVNGEIEGASGCNDHDSSQGIQTHEHDEVSRLKAEVVALRRELAEAAARLRKLEDQKKS
jgi:predicted Fe-Mo cluster-binding NifX family protein